MIIDQISVFVENKAGRLAEITSVLKDNRIDIRALSIADTNDFGILRLIVNQPDKAVLALKSAGYTVSLTNVIAVGVEDRPGGLGDALKPLYDNGISVEYMYAFITPEDGTAFVILRVQDNEKAIEILRQNHIRIMQNEDICK